MVKDYVKLITGILISLVGLFLIIQKGLSIVMGIIFILFGLIILFNKFENKIEQIKR